MKTCTRKKTLLAVVVFCISFCLSSAFAVTHGPGKVQKAPEAKAQPSIQVKELDYNFGEILEGTEVEHEFTVRNTGTAVLNIERVQVD
ncbi:MAG: DUF1573 domain-containing protein [Syntrophobacteraceae bacterium]